MTEHASAPAPSMETIARALDQAIEEQRETRARLDHHTELTGLRLTGLESQLENARSTSAAQFLVLANEFAETKKHVLTIEEHVGLLTTMVTGHGQRLDGIDNRLDGIDTRLDGIDTRLDGHDKRFDTLTTMVEQIRDAVVPGADDAGR
ncbi:MAG: hypothetical protein QM611_08330 [Microbacterium sp.]|uniref:hypothetical protein n=1 Tax=Microbacterium sp. TaxID=51671 RepID=UPI0039E234C6